MPKKNNDAYALNFFGKFIESYAASKNKNDEYKSKLAENELKRKREEKEAQDKKAQQDFENNLRIGEAERSISRLGQKSEYRDEKGNTYTAAAADPATVEAQKRALSTIAKSRGYATVYDPAKPAQPVQAAPYPLPQPGVNLVPFSPLKEPPLPPLPNQAPLPVAAPPVPPQVQTPEIPKEFKKMPTFEDDSIRMGAEERRAIMGLSDDYEREAKPFKEATLAYGDARSSYQRAKLAKMRGESSTAADKDLVLAMIGARQGSRISDADFRLAMEQGSIDERTANYFKMAVNGQMDDSIRDQIFKLTRDSVVNREREYAENVEKPFTEKAKFMAPGADPKFVVRPVRPADWNKIKGEYDKEYEQLNKSTNATWTQDREADLLKKKAELEAIRKRKGK